MAHPYLPETITREQADVLPGVTVLQFGTDWCGYCRAAEKVIDPVLDTADGPRRVFVEDGKGRPLGRSYRVKLWPLSSSPTVPRWLGSCGPGAGRTSRRPSAPSVGAARSRCTRP